MRESECGTVQPSKKNLGSTVFSKKILIFFSQIPDAFGVCGTMCKVKKDKNLFWGDSQNARTKVKLL